MIEQYSHHPRVRVIFAPHAPYTGKYNINDELIFFTVDDPTFKKIRDLSEKYKTKIHCHIHETATEVEDHIVHPGKQIK